MISRRSSGLRFWVIALSWLAGSSWSLAVSHTSKHSKSYSTQTNAVHAHASHNWTLSGHLQPAVSIAPSGTSLKATTCGKAGAVAKSEKIAGGWSATPNEYPWQAFLEIWLKRANLPFPQIVTCTGTLISDKWILTSAFCVDGATSIDVYLGSHDMNQYEASRVKFTSATFFIHPSWDSHTLAGDVALIQLPYAAVFNDQIRPVCLPALNDPNHEGDVVYLSGWGGTTSSNSATSVLKKTVTSVISNTECRSVYGNIVTESLICSSGSGGKGICAGDMGGPMAYAQADGTFTQIGIASFYSTTGCGMGRPSGFTRIRNYLTWISSTTGITVSNSAHKVNLTGVGYTMGLLLSTLIQISVM